MAQLICTFGVSAKLHRGENHLSNEVLSGLRYMILSGQVTNLERNSVSGLIERHNFDALVLRFEWRRRGVLRNYAPLRTRRATCWKICHVFSGGYGDGLDLGINLHAVT